jgi:hypothetical protein
MSIKLLNGVDCSCGSHALDDPEQCVAAEHP